MTDNYFNRKNYIAIFIGIALLIFGYYLLSMPPVDGWVSTTVAPIILTLTYIFYFPYFILMAPKNKKNKGA